MDDVGIGEFAADADGDHLDPPALLDERVFDQRVEVGRQEETHPRRLAEVREHRVDQARTTVARNVDVEAIDDRRVGLDERQPLATDEPQLRQEVQRRAPVVEGANGALHDRVRRSGGDPGTHEAPIDLPASTPELVKVAESGAIRETFRRITIPQEGWNERRVQQGREGVRSPEEVRREKDLGDAVAGSRDDLHATLLGQLLVLTIGPLPRGMHFGVVGLRRPTALAQVPVIGQVLVSPPPLGENRAYDTAPDGAGEVVGELLAHHDAGARRTAAPQERDETVAIAHLPDKALDECMDRDRSRWLRFRLVDIRHRHPL
ncbi:MAG TPA: hypothetical protein VK762_19450 [Polyangiaceae bacterium]|nr:hypothetical protein [Polyangiaceae bacterium]